jgi:superfamily II DNA or RNA helicase
VDRASFLGRPTRKYAQEHNVRALSNEEDTVNEPLHPKAPALFKSGLFSNLSSFRELELRLMPLDEKTKGDAFEVFAEAYLATQRKHDAAKVWPLNAAPLHILEMLSLLEQDYGIDGIFKTVLGQHNAYQVKFRGGRKPLTWRELSTFMALADSPHISSRILLTNCDELPAVTIGRQGFFCIRGADLDRLEPDDLHAIDLWLAGSAVELPKKQPLEHQNEALAVLVPALRENARVSTIMACGTGKTLVALWAAEQLPASRILVLLPSLALLRQTLHEWLRETNLPAMAYLCVCSDPTVTEGADALVTTQSDLDFEVSTNANSVRQFLDAPFAGTKVVFSTYQSASVVAAAMKPGETFELGIFDEAHKTAGREGRNFGLALDDSRLSLQKRLFVTATPRHYNPHERDEEGEAQVVFSMDNPEVYGRQVFRLAFGEAARRGIICNYKIIISVITSEMVTDELLSRGEVTVNGDAVRARQVANQIALRDVVEKYGVSKIFTFHKTVKSAQSFVADRAEGIGTHLANFGSYHVNGGMPTAHRERVMREFRGAARAVMSNARCLTEGVDVPAVDMVAFMSPRRSRVDIVQATGRAMRRAPGKTIGYILLPLYLELAAGESVEDAVRRTDFDEVWDVLQSLQEQDEVLAELIRQVGEQKGRGRGFDDRGFADRIDFGGPRLSLENLRAAVTTRCLENLCSSWDTWLGKLSVFKDRFGHCNVETGWKEDPPLASWVSAQRNRRKKGSLGDDQIARLDEIGFVWDYQQEQTQETWRKWYRVLETYVREHGNSNVPRTHSNSKLASWVWIQRQRRNGTLSARRGHTADQITVEQVRLLDNLGFRWDARDDQWMENFEKLKAYKAKHGHCDVGIEEEGDDAVLLRWMKKQRQSQKTGELTVERKALLDSIGFSWSSETNDRKWREMFQLLQQYHAEHGDADVSGRSRVNQKLGYWVRRQRERRKENFLEDEQIKMLDELGFTWKSRDVGTWEDRLAEVAAFKAQHGHCDIPLKYPENPRLGRFVNNTRTQRNSGKLAADRIAKLDALGFVWSASRKPEVGEDGISEAWRARFEELRAYKASHGDCDVPARWPENPQLGAWASMQRELKKREALQPKRVELLEDLGFAWRAIGEPWEVRYAELLKFKKKHGTCDVPRENPENPPLGVWVVNQRSKRKRGKLTPERERLLTEANFSWETRSPPKAWDAGYMQLLEFKAAYGHCDVPIRYSENPYLGTWVSNQRRNRRQGKLTPQQERLLEEAGFSWAKKNRASVPSESGTKIGADPSMKS